MKKTKIVATIGPVTESQEMLEKMLAAGMNVMRLNFSHGDFEEHGRRVKNLRAATKKLGITAAILQDLAGPKIRIGTFSTESVTLIPGKKFILTTEDMVGDVNKVSINYKNLPKEVQKGHIIYLHDGKKKLEVLEVKGAEVVCKILVGGEIKSKRGVNLPDSDLSISSLTQKDKIDLKFGLKYNVDFFALSFVRRPEDIIELRKILVKAKSKANIIAKIETPQAVKNIDAIIKEADGIMVARGDLAIEVPAEKVLMIQKMIINKCIDSGKPVITATQMLESMIKSPVPTRAEVSDVANAILDGTDAIMLSEESTLGDYPLEAVNMMSKIASEIEANYPEKEIIHTPGKGNTDITDSITGSVVKTAHDVGAKAIIALTHTGFTARMISRHKPNVPIFALSSNKGTANHLSLSFGCKPHATAKFTTIKDAMEMIRKVCLKDKIAKKGDKVVVAAGSVEDKRKAETNMIIVETI